MNSQTTNPYTYISVWIKWIIFLSVLGVVAYTLLYSKNFSEDFVNSVQKVVANNFIVIMLVFVLMAINIFLEAVKWKFLIGKIETISYQRALEGVLAGIAMGFITPHGIGDYAARILSLENNQRLKAVGTVFICRISQFYVTICFGTIAFVFFLLQQGSTFLPVKDFWLIGLLALCNLLFLLVYFFRKAIFQALEKSYYGKRIIFYIELIRKYSNRELNIVFILSLLRYLVFSTQYVVLLVLFDVKLELPQLFFGVFFILLLKSMIPTFFDLGIREMAAVIIFGAYGISNNPVLFASLSIWLCNIVVPSLLGAVMVLKLKLKNQ